MQVPVAHKRQSWGLCPGFNRIMSPLILPFSQAFPPLLPPSHSDHPALVGACAHTLKDDNAEGCGVRAPLPREHASTVPGQAGIMAFGHLTAYSLKG